MSFFVASENLDLLNHVETINEGYSPFVKYVGSSKRAENFGGQYSFIRFFFARLQL